MPNNLRFNRDNNNASDAFKSHSVTNSEQFLRDETDMSNDEDKNILADNLSHHNPIIRVNSPKESSSDTNNVSYDSSYGNSIAKIDSPQKYEVNLISLAENLSPPCPIGRINLPTAYFHGAFFKQEQKDDTYRKMCFKNVTNKMKQQFKTERAQLTISVGQPIHTKNNLRGAIELLNDASFQDCIIMVDDSIQWRTLIINALIKGELKPEMVSLQKNHYMRKAIDAGTEWLRESQEWISALKLPYKIVRWKDWMDSNAYDSALTDMLKIYDITPAIRKAIDDTAKNFLSRKITNDHPLYELCKTLCIDYLIEECAVMKHFWPTLGAHREMYPNDRTAAMATTHELEIKPLHPDLLHALTYRTKGSGKKNVPLDKQKERNSNLLNDLPDFETWLSDAIQGNYFEKKAEYSGPS
ncbi:MAG: tRNA-dependent cyclodipeptide synthase [Gammaproteobacteria bacterium]|nr:tRNA-dependent cyclodipeptide synthase [Gammaproteobacteria bacterium]